MYSRFQCSCFALLSVVLVFLLDSAFCQLTYSDGWAKRSSNDIQATSDECEAVYNTRIDQLNDLILKERQLYDQCVVDHKKRRTNRVLSDSASGSQKRKRFLNNI